MKVEFSKRQLKMLNELLSQFGAISPNTNYEMIRNENKLIVKFCPQTIKLLVQNGKNVRHKTLGTLCFQLSKCVGMAKCNPDDTFEELKGTRLAKLKFTKNVANIIIGIQKQLHSEQTRKVENFTKRMKAEVDKIKVRIAAFKGANNTVS
ncbi:hypothetical protein [Methanoculleus sp.]|jgi:hypothetical protein|uniref:hypothetical protein n=1 Tax=Methanoculleus sp. TaxID=90427 RepID=UPI0025E31E33|nr:hypothetical protein [Methanoculleus sp.]MCK9319457.1 hypothetical protein [Methanoculleus sp.]